MFKKFKFPPTLTKRFGMLIAMAGIVVLAAACGSSASPAAPVAAPGNVPAAAAPVAAATQVATPAIPASNYPDACTVLTQDAVSKVLGTPVDTAVSSGLGGVCTYTSKAASLKIDFTIAGHTGGAKAMNTQLARLGNLALVVPGLGDQAFYNTNPDVGSPLFLLKGDAEYMFGMSDLNYQPLDPAVIQATEKALAVQLLSNLQ
jgi:drug/metabolite transporter (DMT)-like permease